MSAAENIRPREGLPVVRFAMILSSLTPLFLLWAIRGVKPLSDSWVIPSCIALIVIPNIILFLRIRLAQKRRDCRSIKVEAADDPRDHLLVYLFAMLIPLFDANIGTARDSAATIVALIFVVFLFWHLNLHYMNVVFAMMGYRVFTVRECDGTQALILLSKRSVLRKGADLIAFRLSNSVNIEKGEL